MDSVKDPFLPRLALHYDLPPNATPGEVLSASLGGEKGMRRLLMTHAVARLCHMGRCVVKQTDREWDEVAEEILRGHPFSLLVFLAMRTIVELECYAVSPDKRTILRVRSELSARKFFSGTLDGGLRLMMAMQAITTMAKYPKTENLPYSQAEMGNVFRNVYGEDDSTAEAISGQMYVRLQDIQFGNGDGGRPLDPDHKRRLELLHPLRYLEIGDSPASA